MKWVFCKLNCGMFHNSFYANIRSIVIMSIKYLLDVSDANKPRNTSNLCQHANYLQNCIFKLLFFF